MEGTNTISLVILEIIACSILFFIFILCLHIFRAMRSHVNKNLTDKQILDKLSKSDFHIEIIKVLGKRPGGFLNRMTYTVDAVNTNGSISTYVICVHKDTASVGTTSRLNFHYSEEFDRLCIPHIAIDGNNNVDNVYGLLGENEIYNIIVDSRHCIHAILNSEYARLTSYPDISILAGYTKLDVENGLTELSDIRNQKPEYKDTNTITPKMINYMFITDLIVVFLLVYSKIKNNNWIFIIAITIWVIMMAIITNDKTK